jgi:hypothetical protein
LVDVPQVPRKPITKQEERDLEHDGESLHRDIEMPDRHPGHLPMSVSTSLYQRPAHLDLVVSVQPLLPKHGEASGGNRHRETGIHRTLNADVALVREFPIEGWRINVLPKRGGVGVLDEDAEEFCGRFAEIFFDVLLDVDDER